MKLQPSDISLCPGCGRKIIWVLSSDPLAPEKPATKVPLDAVAACYRPTHPLGGREGLAAVRDRDVFLNHFVTCRAREQFRRPRPTRTPASGSWPSVGGGA